MKHKIVLIFGVWIILVSALWVNFRNNNEQETSLHMINMNVQYQYTIQDFEVSYDSERIYGQLYLPQDTKDNIL